MTKLFSKLKSKKGFLSLEMMIIAGILILVAVLCSGIFQRQSTKINQNFTNDVNAGNQYYGNSISILKSEMDKLR